MLFVWLKVWENPKEPTNSKKSFWRSRLQLLLKTAEKKIYSPLTAVAFILILTNLHQRNYNRLLTLRSKYLLRTLVSQAQVVMVKNVYQSKYQPRNPRASL